MRRAVRRALPAGSPPARAALPAGRRSAGPRVCAAPVRGRRGFVLFTAGRHAPGACFLLYIVRRTAGPAGARGCRAFSGGRRVRPFCDAAFTFPVQKRFCAVHRAASGVVRRARPARPPLFRMTGAPVQALRAAAAPARAPGRAVRRPCPTLGGYMRRRAVWPRPPARDKHFYFAASALISSLA